MITIETARILVRGMYVYHKFNRNVDGSPQRWKITSINFWKRDKDRFRVGLKRGLREWDEITNETYSGFQYTTDPTKVLPVPLRSGCHGSEIVNSKNVLYVFDPMNRTHGTYDFNTGRFTRESLDPVLT